MSVKYDAGDDMVQVNVPKATWDLWQEKYKPHHDNKGFSPEDLVQLLDAVFSGQLMIVRPNR